MKGKYNWSRATFFLIIFLVLLVLFINICQINSNNKKNTKIQNENTCIRNGWGNYLVVEQGNYYCVDNDGIEHRIAEPYKAKDMFILLELIGMAMAVCFFCAVGVVPW